MNVNTDLILEVAAGLAFVLVFATTCTLIVCVPLNSVYCRIVNKRKTFVQRRPYGTETRELRRGSFSGKRIGFFD